MARKSNVKATSLSTGDVVEQSKEVIDVNLASQAGDEPKVVSEDVVSDESVVEDDTEQTPSVSPSESPTVKPGTEDPEPPTVVDHKELTKSLALATGIGGLDIDRILGECKTDDDKKKAYERVLWHVGRIKSCNIPSHLIHQGRFNQDGSESKLVKDLKAAFGQNTGNKQSKVVVTPSDSDLGTDI